MLGLELIHAIGMTLIHFIWQGLLIGLVYALGKLMLSKAYANVRYMWALLLFLVMAATPIVTFLSLSPQTATDSHVVSALSSESVTINASVSSPATGPETFDWGQLLPWVVAIWSIGVLVYSLRLLLGWHQVHFLRRTANPQIPVWQQAMLNRMAREFGVWQRVRLAASDYAPGPLLIGSVRPLIIIPTALISGLSRDQVEMVLAHELSHLRRMDHWINILQTIVETLFFFHPVVRWISRDLRIERELACDAMAANYTGSRAAYAETLLQLEQARPDRIPLPLSIAMADYQVAGRVRRLLYPGRRQGGAVGLTMAVLTLVASGTGMVMHERFQNNESDPSDETAQTTPDQPELSQPELHEPSLSENDLEAEKSSEELKLARADTVVLEASPSQELPDGSISAGDSLEVADSDTDTPEQTGSDEIAEEPGEPQTTESKADTESAEHRSEGLEGSQESSSTEDTDAGSDSNVGEDSLDNPAAEPPTVDLDTEDQETTELAQASMDQASTDFSSSKDGPTSGIEEDREEADGNLEGGAIRHQAPPEYPSRARRLQSSGKVELAFTVDTEGRVTDVEILSEQPSNHDLGRAAKKAVKEWRFEPFTRNGMPVEHRVETGFDFQDPAACSPGTGTRLNRC